MPGILGFITQKPREWAEPQLARMLAAVQHDPTYESGTWIDESTGLYLGWTAHNNAFASAMPVCSETGDVVLFFSGEEFPEPGIRQALAARGHELGANPACYLAHIYEEDPAFPSSLNGRFHGLVVDRRRSHIMLFNDRFDMHRLYYHEAKDTFYFSAEAKAILAVCKELRAIDRRGLGEFVACGCVFDNRTLFEGIHVLPPASIWCFQTKSLRRKSLYFDPVEWETQDPLEPEAYYREVRGIFSQNLPRYFNGRQRLAMSLTGGLDTRMIMAWRRPEPESLPCYTFAGMFRDCRDVAVARKVAHACRQTHQLIPVESEFLNQFPHYAERSVYLTDACVDVSRSPDLYVNRFAREIAPVRISGTYGSEVLRGVRAYKPWQPSAGLFRPEFLTSIEEGKRTCARVRQAHPLSCAVFRTAPQRGVDALEGTQLSVRSPYLDNDLIRTVYRSPAALSTDSDVFADNEICSRLIREGNPALSRIRTDRGLIGPEGQLGAMFSRSILEFTFKAEYAYDYGMPQWLAGADHLLAPLRLERAWLGRHKFYHFRVWYRDALSAYVREMLFDPRTLSRPYLEPKAMQRMVARHLKGDRNYTAEIHSLLTLEHLHRLFVDPP